MSSSQFRPSILLRPRKDPNPALAANETLQLEHNQQEQRLALKRAQRAERERQRGQALWGDAADKAEIAERERRAHADFVASRRAVQEQERAQQERLAQQNARREAELRQAEMAKLAAKKEYLASLREENGRLAEQRRQIAEYQREEEKAAIRAQQGQGLLDRFGRHAF